MSLDPSTSLPPIPWARPSLGPEELRELIDCFESGWLSNGPRVERLETELAIRAGRRFAVAVSNGTAALDLAMRVLNVGPGDEVVVPALTYIATAASVALQHATPVFADVDPRNLGINPACVDAGMTRRTTAVVCTDHGGNPCDYTKLEALCSRQNVPLVVDGAQSLGSTFAGRPTLSYGLLSTTSFHAAKTMTTVEGGMVFTDDAELARRMRIIRSQGEDPQQKYYHIELGHNFRMTELQAAIGLAQVRKLDMLLEDRQTLAQRYRAYFAPLGVQTPPGIADAHNSYFLYTLLIRDRDRVASKLKQRGIDTRACYPLPVYRQPIFRHLPAPPCPVAESACAQILNPPMFSGLNSHDQRRVADELKAALDEIVPGYREAV